MQIDIICVWWVMVKWENTIKQAQSAVQNKIYTSAIALNKEALKIACNTYEENLKCDIHKAISSVMISHFSLADAYTVSQSYDQAYFSYQQAFYFIQTTYKSTNYQTIDFKASVYHAINKLKYEWSTFDRLYNDKILEQHFIPPNEFQDNLDQILILDQTIH